VLHRLMHLHREVYGQEDAELLFGPVVEWVSSRRARDMASGEAHTMAAAITPDPGDADPFCDANVRFMLALRMCVLYTRMPKEWPEAHVPYLTGIAMDLHVPALRLGPGKCDIHTLYAQRCAPDQVKMSSLVNDEGPTLSASVMWRIWRSYGRADSAVVKSTSRASKTETVQRGTSRRRTFKPLPDECILPEWAPPSKVDTDPSPPEDTLCTLLSKGMPRAPTTRNVIPLFLSSLGTAEGRRIAVIFVLGAWIHAKHIAPPSIRVLSEGEIVDLIAPLDEKTGARTVVYKAGELSLILTEHIAANVRHYPTMSTMIRSDSECVRFCNSALSTADDFLRPRCHPGPPPPKPPRIKPPAPRPVDGVRVFWSLVAKCEVRAKVRVDTVAKATKDISLKEFYAALKGHPNRFRLYGAVLRRIGMSEADHAILRGFVGGERGPFVVADWPGGVRVFRGDTVARSPNPRCLISLAHPELAEARVRRFVPADKLSKVATLTCQALSAEGNAKLTMYLHYLVHRAQVSWQPILTAMPEAVCPPEKSPFLLVCNDCFTVRSPCRMVRDPTKPRNRVAVDITSTKEVVACTDCNSTDINFIDMRTHFVTAPAPGAPALRCTFALCRGCGDVTETHYIIGLAHLCRLCYHNASKHFVVHKCLCGRKPDARRSTESAVALDERGRPVLIGFCHRHTHAVSHAHPHDIMPVAFYKALIG